MAACAFAHDALETLLLGGGEELGAGGDEVVGVADTITRLEDGFEQLLALDQGDGAQIVAVEIQEIEGAEDDGMGAREAGDGAGLDHVDAVLEELETGAALRVEGGDFAIDDGLTGPDVMREDGELGVLFVDGVAFARTRRSLPASRKHRARTPSHLIS